MKRNSVPSNTILCFTLSLFTFLKSKYLPSSIASMKRDTRDTHTSKVNFVGIARTWKSSSGSGTNMKSHSCVWADVPHKENCSCPWTFPCHATCLLPLCIVHITWQTVTSRQRWFNLHHYPQKHFSPLLHHYTVLCLHCLFSFIWWARRRADWKDICCIL